MPAGQHWSPHRNAQVTVDVCCEPGNHSQPTCPAGLLCAGYPGVGERLGRQLAAVSRLAVLLHVHRYNLLPRVRACCCLPCIVTLWAVPPDLNTLAPRAIGADCAGCTCSGRCKGGKCKVFAGAVPVGQWDQ